MKDAPGDLAVPEGRKPAAPRLAYAEQVSRPFGRTGFLDLRGRPHVADEPESDDLEVFVERAPFEQIPTALWMGGTKAGACSPQAVQAYLLLRQSGADAGFSIKRKKLAAKVGKSPRTVDAWIDELVEKGWLLKQQRWRATGDKQQTSNRYLLLWEQITGDDDPRYQRHLAQVARFEREMQERRAANRAAADTADERSDPLAENCYPPSQDPATPPSRKLLPKTQTSLPTLLSPDSQCAGGATAGGDVDPQQQQSPDVPRENAAAAAADHPETDDRPAGRDAPRAARPADLLAAAGLDATDAAAFLSWLSGVRGYRNPAGMVVTMHRDGDLADRITDWRADAGTPRPVTHRPAWCGRCDEHTRQRAAHDPGGHEYMARCPDCHPTPNLPRNSTQAARQLADDARRVRDTGEGRRAFQEALRMLGGDDSGRITA